MNVLEQSPLRALVRDTETPERFVVLPSGERLALFASGAGLVHPESGVVMGLSPQVHIGLSRGVLWHRLELGDKKYSVRSGVLAEALTILGLHRLRARRRCRRPVLLDKGVGPLWQSAVAAVLDAEALPLLLVPTKTRLVGQSRVLGEVKPLARLLLSDRGCDLIAVSKVGDVLIEPLAPPFSFDDKWLVTPSRRVHTWRWLDPHQEAFGQVATDRVLTVARYAFSHADVEARRVASFLEPACEKGDLRALWVHWFLLLVSGDDVPFPDALQRGLDVDPSALFASWKFPSAELDRIFARLPPEERFDALAEKWAERVFREQRIAEERGRHAPAERVARRADLEFARRLRRRNRPERARRVLSEARHMLPRPSVLHADRPFAVLDHIVADRVRLEQECLELADTAEERLETQLRLLALRPLSKSVLSAVCEAPDGLGARAREVLTCLTEAALPEPEDVPRRRSPLAADVVDRRLRRDLGDFEPSLGLRFKTWIATEPRPDAALLKHYCERVTRADAPILRIVDEAATVLGLGHIDVYVSRGDDDVGIRAYDNKRPFLLVGGRHLDGTTTYAMTSRELSFCVGTELLHLRAGNARVSSRDVWRGAFQTGRKGLDVAFGVLPLLQGLKLANRLSLVTAKLSLPQVGKFLDATGKVQRAMAAADEGNEAHGLSPAAEKLIEQQRELQLWADRVGILCSGSFRSAIRAITITRHDTARVARELMSEGLLAVADRHHKAEPDAFEYLMLRVANLSSFYVSDEYGILASLVEGARKGGAGSDP